jgi:L-asparaginase
MIVLGNVEAGPGIAASVAALKAGRALVPALVEGVSLVEAAETVRSVGYGGWPNLLGVMECDGAVMEGDQRRVGAVAAVPGVLHVARLAQAVMQRLPHVMLSGAGARRFADELGFAPAEVLHPDSRRVWWDKLAGMLSAEEQAAFPDVPLIPLVSAITDPEKVRDTTVFLGQDHAGSLGAVTSTSGWAWKYPGRIGDAPIPGAGFYADSRYGAAACTHTGEMTMRAMTAHRVVEEMRLGAPVEAAVRAAAADLLSLRGGFLAEVVIHAIDTKGGHFVLTVGAAETVGYWVWTEELDLPERRISAVV